jgi:acetyl-CoA carboxylase carboxyltransferase component
MDVQGKTDKLFALRDSIEAKSKSGARKRLEALFDEGSFVETAAFVKQRPTEYGFEAEDEGVVTGYGSVNGLLVYAFAQEPSVMKGSVSEMHAKKILDLLELAYKAEAPVVSMIDSCGLRVGEGVDALQGYGDIISAFTRISGICPHVSIVFGTCSGAFSFIPAVADYTVMMEKAELFLSAPVVVKAKFGDLTQGTAEKAYANGTVSEIVATEEEAIYGAKCFLDAIEDEEPVDDVNRLLPELNTILADDNYDVRQVIEAIADEGNVLYFADGSAKNAVAAIIKLDGRSVGVCANQPAEDNGALDSAAAKKLSKFIAFCDNYDLPILTLVDTEGFKPDASESIEDAASLVTAYAHAGVPMVTVALHKAYGSGYVSMCPKSAGADVYYAFTTAEIAPLPPEVGGVFFADEAVKNSDDPIKARAEAIEKYKDITASPLEAAKRGYIDDIIEPATARQLIISAFNMFE